MTAERYRVVLVQQWPFLVLCIAVAVSGALLGSLLVKPVYRATVVLTLDIPPTSSQVVVTSDKYVQGSVQLATSNAILADVAAHFPGLTAGTLANEVAASPILNTHSLQIVVSDEDGLRSAAIANGIAADVISQQQQNQLQADDEAELPIRTDIANTQQSINLTQQQMATLPSTADAATQMAVLQANLASLQQQYSSYQNTLATIQQAEATSAISVYVAQPAIPGTQPQRPQTPAFVGAAFLVGLFLGLVLLIVRDVTDQRVREATDISTLLGWPVLATITARTKDADMCTLQKNLAFLNVATPLHSLVVTSADVETGSDAVAADLAQAWQHDGQRTILIDANLRRPTQAQRFGLPASEGFSDAILAYHAPSATVAVTNYLQSAAQETNTALAIMPAGTRPPNPAELVRSAATAQLFAALAALNADRLVFATPALTEAPEAAYLAGTVNGTIVVVELAQARRDVLLRAKTTLEDAQAHILGCVVLLQKEASHA